jgi:protein-glutamine gamma-glutamyltransferase
MSRRLYKSEVVLLLAAMAPLAVAEGLWWLLGLTVAGAVLGWWRTVRQDRPVLGQVGSRVAVVLAFALMVAECLFQMALPVLALAHFMGIVCVCKLLQRRTLRDHAHLFVLSLLMLVVGAIVSAGLIFPAALAVFLTVGLSGLIRFHLLLEAARAAGGEDAALAGADDACGGAVSTLLPTALAGTCGLIIGAGVFILCPRVGAGVLGRFEPPVPIGGPVITGLSPALNFNTIGPIQESQRPVMRVQIGAGDSAPMQLPGGPYFRGGVLSQYHRVALRLGPIWEWQRFPVEASEPYRAVLRKTAPGGRIALLGGVSEDALLVQTYWLETNEANSIQQLFACFPAVNIEFEGQAPDEVKKWVEDQILQVQRPPTRLMRYTVRSSLRQLTAAAALRAEREETQAPLDPPVIVPSPPLPRAAEMDELIARLRRGLGPLDVPQNRLFFLQRVRDYLRSAEFTYTLQPPPVRAGKEPIGEFLFTTRRGHCEYFASAMAVLAQLAGVPARVACGYRGGDYNPVGDFYVVRQKHAHSWVETYIPGMDWVSFDPTPSAERGGRLRADWLGGSKYLDYFQFLWGNAVVSYDADQRRELFARFTAWLLRPVRSEATIIGGLSAFVRELFGWRLDLNWRQRSVYWLFTLLVLAACGLLAFVATGLCKSLARCLREWYARRRQLGLPSELRFYEQFVARLARLGLSRRPDQTPFEFAAEAARKLPACGDAEFLVATYYEACYGGRSPGGSATTRIERFLAEFSSELIAPAKRATQGPR